jgi:hypothetical protein
MGEQKAHLAVLATLHAYGISNGAPQDTQFEVQGINQKFIEFILTKTNRLTKKFPQRSRSAYNNE